MSQTCHEQACIIPGSLRPSALAATRSVSAYRLTPAASCARCWGLALSGRSPGVRKTTELIPVSATVPTNVASDWQISLAGGRNESPPGLRNLTSRRVMKNERNPTTYSPIEELRWTAAAKLDPVTNEAGYFAYIVGPNGQFLWPREFVAANDDVALELAQKLGEYVELWSGARFVKKLRLTSRFGLI
jgi:hypothetical protein